MKKKELMDKLPLYKDHIDELSEAHKLVLKHCKDKHEENCSDCHHFFGNQICSICDLGILSTFNEHLEKKYR